ncbi:nitroreductase family protein [bacterium]|nr:nitroreductase family protein [bacterium]MBU1635206.1 nitroreductase family protein [bacterium]MBU1874384.1 nitroreductase family protein [bacterium]
MELNKVFQNRRAIRTLGKLKITDDLINELAKAAGLAPSCNNMQPWRFVFVYEPDRLQALFESLAPGNYWAKKASLMIAVFSKKELDCVIKEREYYQFDTGMATAHLTLKATDLGLVTHPMAGFSPEKARAVLNIPDDMQLITLIAVGKRLDTIDPELSEKHQLQEPQRPPRLNVEDFVYLNEFK